MADEVITKLHKSGGRCQNYGRKKGGKEFYHRNDIASLVMQAEEGNLG